MLKYFSKVFVTCFSVSLRIKSWVSNLLTSGLKVMPPFTRKQVTHTRKMFFIANLENHNNKVLFQSWQEFWTWRWTFSATSMIEISLKTSKKKGSSLKTHWKCQCQLWQTLQITYLHCVGINFSIFLLASILLVWLV